MIIRALEHARSNAIAYLALCISLLALAGGAYAAFTLPANSVGARQIRNGSIDPVKLDHATIGGTIRHWAQISAEGQIVSSSGNARQQEQPNTTGKYLVSWAHDRFPKGCTVVATVLQTFSSLGGFASPLTFPGAAATLVQVQTFNPQGTPANEVFSLAVMC